MGGSVTPKHLVACTVTRLIKGRDMDVCGYFIGWAVKEGGDTAPTCFLFLSKNVKMAFQAVLKFTMFWKCTDSLSMFLYVSNSYMFLIFARCSHCLMKSTINKTLKHWLYSQFGNISCIDCEIIELCCKYVYSDDSVFIDVLPHKLNRLAWSNESESRL